MTTTYHGYTLPDDNDDPRQLRNHINKALGSWLTSETDTNAGMSTATPDTAFLKPEVGYETINHQMKMQVKPSSMTYTRYLNCILTNFNGVIFITCRLSYMTSAEAAYDWPANFAPVLPDKWRPINNCRLLSFTQNADQLSNAIVRTDGSIGIYNHNTLLSDKDFLTAMWRKK